MPATLVSRPTTVATLRTTRRMTCTGRRHHHHHTRTTCTLHRSAATLRLTATTRRILLHLVEATMRPLMLGTRCRLRSTGDTMNATLTGASESGIPATPETPATLVSSASIPWTPATPVPTLVMIPVAVRRLVATTHRRPSTTVRRTHRARARTRPAPPVPGVHTANTAHHSLSSTTGPPSYARLRATSPNPSACLRGRPTPTRPPAIQAPSRVPFRRPRSTLARPPTALRTAPSPTCATSHVSCPMR